MQMGLQNRKKSDGSIELYETRLVILGDTQVEGLDYLENFAPLVKMVIIHTLLTVSAS